MMFNSWMPFKRNSCLGIFAGLLALFIPACVEAQLNVRWDPLLEPGCGGWAVSIEVSPLHNNWILAGGDILATGLSTDGGWNWQQPSGFLDWELGDFTWHPTNPLIAWAGTLGGPYLTNDGGHTWTSQRSGMPAATNTACTAPIQKVIYDPNNSNTLLAFGGNQRDFITPSTSTAYGAVWKSTNGGSSWTKLTTLGVVSGVEGANIRNAAFAAGSSSIVYCCSADSTKEIWISINGGTSWTLSSSGLPNDHVQNVQTHPTNPNIAWVSLDGGGGVYETTNGGSTWVACNSGLTLDSTINIQALAVAPSNGSVLYCSAQDTSSSQNSRTYSSTNGGASWNVLIDNDTDYSTIIGGTMDPNDVVVFKFLSVDPNNATHVVGTTEGLVLESWNSGATWYDVCSYTADNHKRGKGYSGVCGCRCKWDPYTPGFVMPLGLDDSKLNRSSDYMYSFTDTYAGLATPFDGAFDVGFAPNNIIYVGTGYYPTATDAIAKSINGGTSWTNCSRPAGVTGRNEGIYVLPTDTTGNTVYSLVSNNSFNSPASGVYLTTNGGSSWTTLLSSSTAGVLYSMTGDPTTNTIYVGGGNGIYKCTNGTTFTLMSGMPNPWSYLYSAQKVDPLNSSTLFCIGFRNSTVYRYSGGTWTNIFNKYAAYDIAVDPNNDQRLAICTHGYPGQDLPLGNDGIWITTNGGTNWTNYSTGLRILSASSLDFNPDHSAQLVQGTDGCGFYVTDLGTSTPFTGASPSVVGVMQAENYDLGGINCAYSHATPGNRGGDNYRLDTVDIKAEGTGHAVSNMTRGEWLKYSVNVPSTGYYDITLNAMSIAAGGQFHVEMNGNNITGPIAIGNTGGVWKNVSARGVRMIAGTQYMKVYCEAGGADLDYISTALSTNGINITSVSSGAAYDVGMSSLGAVAYIDEPYLLAALTPTLQNLPMIQTAMGDAAANTTNNVTFTLDQSGTVYVAIDKRLTTLPAFLTGWTLTTESTDINSGVSAGYNVYSKHFAAGSVTLGGNHETPAAGSGSMYMVFIKRD